MNSTNEPLKALVADILGDPFSNNRKWTYQGLGMLRLYLSNRFRMHVWCPSRAVPSVSTLHTHPWDFTSHIVVGEVRNICYLKLPVDGWCRTEQYLFSRIKCGAGGGAVSEPIPCFLAQATDTTYGEGENYSEEAEVIHESKPVEGTVTIVDRIFKPDTDHADVYWKAPGSWVSAEPRPATEDEINYFCNAALAQFK